MALATILFVGLFFFYLWRRQRQQVSEEGPLPGFAAEQESYRWLSTVLLVAGMLIMVLSQGLYATTADEARQVLTILFGLGLMLFLLAGHTVASRDFALWRNRLLRNVSGYFGLHPAQLILIILALISAYLAHLAAGDGLRARQPILAATAWILAILSAVAAGLRWGEWRRSLPALPRWEVLLTLALFLAALALRIISLNELPATLSGDEASAGLVAVQFRQGQADNLLGLGWFSFPSFFFALQSVGVRLLGQTAAALRLTSAFAGALTVVGLYWLGRIMFGRLAGALAALYLLGSHFHIHFSRIGLQNIWDGMFLVWILLAMWHGWKSGRRTSFILGGLLLGLGQYFYVSLRILPLLLLLWAGIAFLVRREDFRRRLPDLLLAAFVAFVVVLPLLLVFLQHPDEFSAPLNRVSIFNGWLETEMARTGHSAARIVLDQMWLTAAGFAHRPLRHWYNPGVPLLLPAAGALFVAGVLWSLYEADLRSALLVLPLMAFVVMGGFSQDAPASQRFVLVMPLAALFVALALFYATVWLGQMWPRGGGVLAALALFFMVLIVAGDLKYYFTDAYDEYVLGGHNTQTATVVARYLQKEPAPAPQVYFFGLPRMGYFSLSTIPYLAPRAEGHDVARPLTAPPSWILDRPTLFVFLPERFEEMKYVEDAYPGGRPVAVTSPRSDDGDPLFYVYRVRPSSP